MTMLHDFENQIQVQRFRHELLEQQDEHIKTTAEKILKILRVNEDMHGDPQLIIYSGTMGSGKTTLTKLLNNELENTFIIRLNDDRASEGQMFDRNDLELKQGSKVISFPVDKGKEIIISAIDNRPSIKYLFLSEGQFLGTQEEILEVIEYAKSKGITLIFDCLSIFFNGRKVPKTEYIKQLASYSFDMWACDRFSAEKARMPMRVVRIDEEGNMPDAKDQTSAKYYLGMIQEKRKELYEKVQKSKFAQKLTKIEGEKRVCLVPSHPEIDDIYVAGQDERYFSTTVEMCCEILRSIGLDDVAQIYENIQQEEA